MTSGVLIVVVWLAVGAAVGLVQARHGYWRRGWIVAVVLGPFAAPMALHRRRIPAPAPTVVARGRAGLGRIDVLVGLDGSPSSMTAAGLAVELFGPRLGRITLATVLDLDTREPHGDSVLYPEPWPEERAALERLELAVASLDESSGHEAGAVVLAGDPATALRAYAAAHGYEVIVVGRRGGGLSKRLLGSCADRLCSTATVPVLLAPAPDSHELAPAVAASDAVGPHGSRPS